MNGPTPDPSTAHRFAVLAMAILLSAVLLAWQGRSGFNLTDEGFLWYGAQQTGHGAMPLRDFMAYDIGRYYWSAAIMRLVGSDGILAVRGSIAAFQAIGLAVALRWLSGRGNRRIETALALLAIALWMVPRHKVFDATLALVLIGTVAWMLETPTVRRYAWSGLVLGLVAVFGRNHGLYGAIAMAGAIALNSIQARGPAFFKGAAAYGAGVVAGYLPVLALLVTDPLFRTMFWEDLRFLFEYGATNLSLPVPWPTQAFRGSADGMQVLRRLLLGVGFMALPAFAVAGAVRLYQQGRSSISREPLFTACVLLALPYAHFAYSRADISHLAQSIFPMLVGLAAWPWAPADDRRKGIAIATLLLAVALILALPQQPGFQSRHPAWVNATVGSEVLHVDPVTATNLAGARKAIGSEPAGSPRVLIAPLWVGLYPALSLRSPIWEIYGLFPRSQAFQQAEIARMQKADVRLALIQDVALDGRETLRYANTHPDIHRYLSEHFERCPAQWKPELELFVARSVSGRPGASSAAAMACAPRQAGE